MNIIYKQAYVLNVENTYIFRKFLIVYIIINNVAEITYVQILIIAKITNECVLH